MGPLLLQCIKFVFFLFDSKYSFFFLIIFNAVFDIK